MTRQEAINKIWDWFIVQKKPPAVKMAKGEGPYNYEPLRAFSR